MRLKGTLVDWKDDRGFGFIEPAEGGKRIFCHLRAFEIRMRRPVSGDSVTYEVGRDAQQRLTAIQVRPVGLEDARYQSNIRSRRIPYKTIHRNSSSTESASSKFALAAICVAVMAFFMMTVWLAYVGRVPPFIPVIYLVMSAVTLVAYALDKRAAMNRHQRTAEQTLHLLELFGGWPGAWIAQQLFRHKTSKVSFRIEFWLCVVVNVAVLVWCAAHLELIKYF